MAYSELVLRHAPWSISKAGMLNLCPRQYDFKYVKRLPAAPSSDASRVGVAIHAVMEYARRNNAEHDELFAELGRLTDTMKLVRSDLVEVSARIPAVLDYVQRINVFKTQHGALAEYIEHKLAIDKEGAPVEFFDNERALMRGVLDDAVLTRDQVLLVVDHKSGRKKKIAEHSSQFYAYMALVLGAFPHVRGVQCAINYIGAPRLDWFPRFDGSAGPWSREEIERHVVPWLERYLNALTKRLTVLDSGQSDPATGWQCEYCGFTEHCEDGRATVQARKAEREGSAPSI